MFSRPETPSAPSAARNEPQHASPIIRDYAMKRNSSFREHFRSVSIGAPFIVRGNDIGSPAGYEHGRPGPLMMSLPDDPLAVSAPTESLPTYAGSEQFETEKCQTAVSDVKDGSTPMDATQTVHQVQHDPNRKKKIVGCIIAHHIVVLLNVGLVIAAIETVQGLSDQPITMEKHQVIKIGLFAGLLTSLPCSIFAAVAWCASRNKVKATTKV